MKSSKRYWIDLAGFLSGEMDNDQQNAFLNKVEMNSSLKNDYKLMKKSWDQFQSNPDDKYNDTQKAWSTLKYRIDTEVLPETGYRVRLTGMQNFVRVAAVILLILAVGIPSVYYTVNQNNRTNISTEHKSTNGMLTVDLPDGSRVFLNEGSKLNVGKSYENNRDVTLQGEGFFDVMADPGNPFTVNTGKVIVTVLGTSFNVKETENSDVQIYVEKGKVQVSMKQNNTTVLLNPGELGEASEGFTTRILEDDNYLSWKTKDFKFVDKSVDQILEVLQEAYHVEVKTEISDLQNRHLTTTYSEQSFDAILSTICTALNLNYQKEGKVYILYSN